MTDLSDFVVDSNEIPWAGGVTGIMRKTLVDLPAGPHARLVRIEAGEEVPRHRHPSNEVMYVLEGELHMHDRVLGPGTCYFKPKSWPYGPLTTTTGVTVLLFFDGPDRFEI